MADSTNTRVLIQHAEVAGQRVSVRLADGQIVAMAPVLDALYDEVVVDAGGGLLLPGLHDHHIHIRALARALTSVDCSPAILADLAAFASALNDVAGTGWVRAVGYDDLQMGELDRHVLDAMCPDRPLRVQHRTGKMWVLNSAALNALSIDTHNTQATGIECDPSGLPTGRLFRMDAWLAEALRQIESDEEAGTLAVVSERLVRLGVTGVTDTSYTNTQASVDSLKTSSEFKPHVYCMGDASLAAGHLKVMLDEDQPPDLDRLVEQVRSAHEKGRGVAFHAVTRAELLLALHVLENAGHHPSDRLEHAAVVEADCLQRIVDSGCAVVTQPGFIAHRGDMYRQEFAGHAADLYRYRSLLDAGIPTAASSDAPYGPYNPWQVMWSATVRQTPSGETLGAAECVSAKEALRGYLAAPKHPGGRPRSITVGERADMCLLSEPWQQAKQHLAEVQVQVIWIDGHQVVVNQPSGAAS